MGSGKDIIYASSARQFETVPLGPGEIVLRIKAEKIPEARGICTLNVKPAFTAQNLRQDEYPFTPLSFTVRISPGYFLFLGPTDSVVPKDSLANLFFRKQGRGAEQGKEEYIKTYLLVCTGIID